MLTPRQVKIITWYKEIYGLSLVLGINEKINERIQRIITDSPLKPEQKAKLVHIMFSDYIGSKKRRKDIFCGCGDVCRDIASYPERYKQYIDNEIPWVLELED